MEMDGKLVDIDGNPEGCLVGVTLFIDYWCKYTESFDNSQD